MSGIDDIRRRLDACYEGTVRERGEAEMEFHRHAMIDVERLLDVAEAGRVSKPRLCTVKGCNRSHRALGWCNMHYQRVYRHGATGPVDTLRQPSEHGTTSMYTNHRCRCDECKRAWREDHYRYMHEDPERLRKAAARERLRRARAKAPVA